MHNKRPHDPEIDFRMAAASTIADLEKRVHRLESLPLGADALTKIIETILTGSATEIDFTNLPQIYTHLKVIGTVLSDDTGRDELHLQCNGDTGGNYDWMYYDADHAGAGAIALDGDSAINDTEAHLGFFSANTSAGDVFSHFEMLVYNYVSTNVDKGMRLYGGHMGAQATGEIRTTNSMSYWRSTAAINRLRFFPQNGNLLTGTRIAIYGVS